MSAFSDRMAATALRLLTNYGEAVSFSRVTEGTYSPSTATTGASSTTSYSGFAVPVDYDTTELIDSVIEQGDIKLYVNATSSVPEVGDQATLDSVAYRVMDVRKYTINSENVMYELQVRI